MISKTLIFLASLLTGGVNATPEPAPARNAVEAAPSNAASQSTRAPSRLGAGDVVSRVQEFYTDTKQLTALFRQTYTNTTFGKTSVSDGKLWIKKPGKMRWDYAGKSRNKVKKSFISDGTILWAVEHDNRQVFKKNLHDDMLPVAVTFLFGQGDLARDFDARLDTSGKYGKKTDLVLDLTPRKPSAQYKKLYLVVDPGNFRVKQSVVVEASGNVNHFMFFSPDTRKPVRDAWFVFNEKKLQNYRVVQPD